MPNDIQTYSNDALGVTVRTVDDGGQVLFRIKETAVTHSDGHVTVSRTPKVTGKGQRVLMGRYCRAGGGE